MNVVRSATCVAVLALGAAASPASAQTHWRQDLLERLQELRALRTRHPLLNAQQFASLRYVYYRSHGPEDREALKIVLPRGAELERFREMREGVESEALDLLDELYGTRDDLEALAVRDRDGDGIPDYRVSDYFGKLAEGDVDVDGDGVRNVYDAHPHDAARGGHDEDGDGVPDSELADRNGNDLPDHVDWGALGRDPALARIQLGLFRDHGIILVERNAEFDLPLARAVDDTVRRVFRAPFEASAVLPTLRTVAVEKTALLSALLAEVAEDETSAQVFSQTQSLTVYDPGRAVEDDLGLLGLLVHEMGHSYHMALDWDAARPDLENGRTDFPTPKFLETVARFGWTTDEYYDGQFAGLKPMPRFLYTGISEPVFLLDGKTPEEWEGWLNAIYEELGEPEDYLEHPSFAREGVVGDYSLSTPYEWYGDNLLAYVVCVLEAAALEGLPADAATEVRERITASLRAVWPAFHHRNIGPEAFAYFEATFPIREDDRRFLAERYIRPIVDSRDDGPEGSSLRHP